MAKATISDLARTLGLSKSSVSTALNGKPGVSEETRKRVLALAADLGWHPSSSARSLSRARSDTIGMVLKRDPTLLGTEPYYMRLLEGVEDVLSGAGQSLLLRMVGKAAGRDTTVYERWSAERRVDGVIVIDRTVDDPRPELLRQLGMPFVLHGVSPGSEPGSEVIDDQLGDARLIADHIAELGHPSFVHVTGPLSLAHEVDRRALLGSETRALGITPSFVESDYTVAGAESAVAEVLRRPEPVTAIVTSNDLMAVGALAALTRAGSENVALISWDDSMLCQFSNPAITALERRPDEAGRRSARLLLELLNDAPLEPPTAERSQLMVRKTSRPYSI